MRPKGTAADLEARRRWAADLLQDGKTNAEVAALVNASRSSVKRWRRALREGGEDALVAKPHPGPKPKLSDAQKHTLRRILIEGPVRHGYSTDLWTCARVAEVIRRRFRVRYNADHLGRVLHALGFSPQKPVHRARERDEAAIERWRKVVWPRLKKRAAKRKLP